MIELFIGYACIFTNNQDLTAQKKSSVVAFLTLGAPRTSAMVKDRVREDRKRDRNFA